MATSTVIARAIERTQAHNRFKLKPCTFEEYRARRIPEINKELAQLRRAKAFGDMPAAVADKYIANLNDALKRLEG